MNQKLVPSKVDPEKLITTKWTELHEHLFPHHGATPTTSKAHGRGMMNTLVGSLSISLAGSLSGGAHHPIIVGVGGSV